LPDEAIFSNESEDCFAPAGLAMTKGAKTEETMGKGAMTKGATTEETMTKGAVTKETMKKRIMTKGTRKRIMPK